MSSHLLGEIERVCDYLVVIEGGRLVRSDSVATFTGRIEVLTVEVDGPVAGLAQLPAGARLRRARGQPHARARPRRTTAPYDAIRDGAASLGLGLIRLEQRRQRLEDLFRDEAEDEVTATRV